MMYTKPKLTVLGDALELIQSSLTKNSTPVDEQNIGSFTADSAYVADE